MKKEDKDRLATQVEDINRLWELGFIGLDERGKAYHRILMQDIADELDHIVKQGRHPGDFPLDK
jgi:hypothetical protein